MIVNFRRRVLKFSSREGLTTWVIASPNYFAVIGCANTNRCPFKSITSVGSMLPTRNTVVELRSFARPTICKRCSAVDIGGRISRSEALRCSGHPLQNRDSGDTAASRVVVEDVSQGSRFPQQGEALVPEAVEGQERLRAAPHFQVLCGLQNRWK